MNMSIPLNLSEETFKSIFGISFTDEIQRRTKFYTEERHLNPYIRRLSVETLIKLDVLMWEKKIKFYLKTGDSKSYPKPFHSEYVDGVKRLVKFDGNGMKEKQ